MNTASFNHSTSADGAQLYVKYLTSDHQNSLILKYSLYLEDRVWSELMQYVSKRGQPLKVFQDLPDSMVAVFKVTRQSPDKPNVIELHGDKTPVKQTTQKVPPIDPCTTIAIFCILMESDREREGRRNENVEAFLIIRLFYNDGGCCDQATSTLLWSISHFVMYLHGFCTR